MMIQRDISSNHFYLLSNLLYYTYLTEHQPIIVVICLFYYILPGMDSQGIGAFSLTDSNIETKSYTTE